MNATGHDATPDDRPAPQRDVVHLDKRRAEREQLVGPIHEGEIVDDEPPPTQTLEPTQVIDAAGTTWTPGAREHKPLLPRWATDKPTAKAAARWGAAYSAHWLAFHALRTPLYALRLALRAPIGAWRILAAAHAWVVDDRNRDARAELRAEASPNRALDDLAIERAQARIRLAVVAGLTLVLAGAATYSALALPAYAKALEVAAVVVALGYAGRNRDKPITGNAVDTFSAPPIDRDLIVEALTALGLARMDPDRIAFPAPIHRDGDGIRADIDLPPGVTATQVVGKRDQLASGLRRPLGCVWPEPDADMHAGRLVLYVGDRSLSATRPTPWPLARAGKVNVFEPIPLGVDQRGRRVDITLMFASGLIGAVPRMGKSFTLRLLLLAAALDPRVEIHAHNLKGGSDFDALGAVAHYYRAGDDPEDMEHLVRDLRAVQTEMRRRYKVIRDLPKDVCPESKVTDQLASRADLGLHPILVALDETQVAFEHPTYSAELIEICTDLVKRGPAVGVMAWFATQRPDAKSIPSGISANAILRLCLKVMGETENRMVLGNGYYAAGIQATMFGRKDVGVAWLVGEGDDPVIVRAAYVDATTAEAIAARARAARLAAGRLTGMAAGQIEPDTDKSTILHHLLEVWPEAEARAHGETLAERLAAAKPELYAGWDAEQVHAAARRHGVRQADRKVAGITRKGLLRRDVTDALGLTDTTPKEA